jgi:hypothetical protein
MPKQKPAYVPESNEKPLTLSDEQLAILLLDRIVEKGADGFLRHRFLSKDTRPTEDEALAALTRLLLNGELSPAILWALARLFAPDGFCPPEGTNFSVGERRVILCNRSKGNPQDLRHLEIAYMVYELRASGRPADEACAAVASKCEMKDIRQIKKIYSNWADFFERVHGPLPSHSRGQQRGELR